MKRVVGLVLIGTILSSCGFFDGGNTPGITSDPKKAAIAIYPENPPTDELQALVQEGQDIFTGSGCVNCHSTTSDRAKLQGPPLAGISAKYVKIKGSDLKARRWLVMHIKSPQEYPGNFFRTEEYPNFMPPSQNVTDSDMKALVEYLWTLK